MHEKDRRSSSPLVLLIVFASVLILSVLILPEPGFADEPKPPPREVVKPRVTIQPTIRRVPRMPAPEAEAEEAEATPRLNLPAGALLEVGALRALLEPGIRRVEWVPVEGLWADPERRSLYGEGYWSMQSDTLRVVGAGFGDEADGRRAVLRAVERPLRAVRSPCAEPESSQQAHACGMFLGGIRLAIESWSPSEIVVRNLSPCGNATPCVRISDMVVSVDGAYEFVVYDGSRVVFGPVELSRPVVPIPPTSGIPDRDGDGYGDHLAGGEDCDDRDWNRFPGNPEICDADGHDEDCDPATFGAIDLDGDGAFDDRCRNVIDGRITSQGTDCNDRAAGAHHGLPEVPGDGLDNDCDGVVR